MSSAIEARKDQQSASLRNKYLSDPGFYIEDVLGVKIWSGMKMVAESVFKNKRTSVRGCHGISKTVVAAAIAVAFLNLYRRSIVITSAPTHRQVARLLWKEVRSIYQKRAGILRGECQTLDIKVAPDCYMLGFSTDQPVAIEGWHSPNILFVLDEAKGLDQWIYDALEGSMIANAHMLEISTTDGADQQCPFRRHHSTERSQWAAFKFSAFDSPYVDIADWGEEYRQYINPKLYDYGKPKKGAEWPGELIADIPIADGEWIKDKLNWKESNPFLWETKILGEFSDLGEGVLIPLRWVERAIEAEVEPPYQNGEIEYGLDVARMGDDTNVLYRRSGWVFEMVKEWGQVDTMQTCGIVKNLIDQMPGQSLKIDSIGVGAGVYDRMEELLYTNQLNVEWAYGINSAAKADNPRKFFNTRAEMWWQARELFQRNWLEGGIMSIPADMELVEDLTGMKYTTKSDGRILVEPKEDFKKRYGRSPNKGDAFIYCLAKIQEEFAIEEWVE